MSEQKFLFFQISVDFSFVHPRRCRVLATQRWATSKPPFGGRDFEAENRVRRRSRARRLQRVVASAAGVEFETSPDRCRLKNGRRSALEELKNHRQRLSAEKFAA